MGLPGMLEKHSLPWDESCYFSFRQCFLTYSRNSGAEVAAATNPQSRQAKASPVRSVPPEVEKKRTRWPSGENSTRVRADVIFPLTIRSLLHFKHRCMTNRASCGTQRLANRSLMVNASSAPPDPVRARTPFLAVLICAEAGMASR